jgi:Flp pilus assembly protein CpaB
MMLGRRDVYRSSKPALYIWKTFLPILLATQTSRRVLIPLGRLVPVRPEKLGMKNMATLQSIFPKRKRRANNASRLTRMNSVLD